MPTYKILCQHFGANADTAHQPIREYSDADSALLSEKVWRCANADFDMPVQVNLYQVIEVTLPDWMSVSEYIHDRIALRYFQGFGGDLAWGRVWFQRLSRLPEGLQYCCIRLLLVKNFRSGFRKSLRDQLEKWLSAESVPYPMPFSSRQLALFVTERDSRTARNVASSIYFAR